MIRRSRRLALRKLWRRWDELQALDAVPRDRVHISEINDWRRIKRMADPLWEAAKREAILRSAGL